MASLLADIKNFMNEHKNLSTYSHAVCDQFLNLIEVKEHELPDLHQKLRTAVSILCQKMCETDSYDVSQRARAAKFVITE